LRPFPFWQKVDKSRNKTGMLQKIQVLMPEKFRLAGVKIT
jgi:hypothetical protein